MENSKKGTKKKKAAKKKAEGPALASNPALATSMESLQLPSIKKQVALTGNKS